MTDGAGFDRRQLIVSGLLMAGAAAAPLAIWQRQRGAETGEASARQMRLLERTSDLVIPATDTPGALATGVPAFVVLALNHGLDGTRDPGAGVTIVGASNEARPKPAGLYLIDALGEALDRLCRGDFLTATPARQAAALEAVDAAAFAPGGEDAAWHKLKGLILTGYYTSEIGGSKELRYELVPGRWDPDVPLNPGDRAWSSDWTAVDFG